MTLLKTILAAAAMVPLLASFALRSEPPPAQAAETRFDLAWMDVQNHKADREALPMPPPVKPRFDYRPIEPAPELPTTVPIRMAQETRTEHVRHRPKYNSCARRGMKRVYHRHRYWCQK